MKTQNVGIFNHEDLEATTQYRSTPVVDMARRVVGGIFFVGAHGGGA